MYGLQINHLDIILYLIALVIAITVHEFSHAYIADRLGDPTPRLMGRVTLNPLAHLDTFGSLIFVVLLLSGSRFVFGWGKPVLFDPFNLRNRRRDAATISLAGPLSNIILAILFSLLLHLIFIYPFVIMNYTFMGLLKAFFVSSIFANIVLAIFNLIPIHPLDGFKIVGGILPELYARQWQELESYGMIFLIFLIFPIFGNTSPINQLISPIINFLLGILLPNAPLI